MLQPMNGTCEFCGTEAEILKHEAYRQIDPGSGTPGIWLCSVCGDAKAWKYVGGDVTLTGGAQGNVLDYEAVDS